MRQTGWMPTTPAAPPVSDATALAPGPVVDPAAGAGSVPDPGVDPAVDPIEVDAVTDAVLTASRVLVGISARSLAAVEDAITVPQFRLLVVLRTRGALKHSALADHLGVTPSTASRMVDRLVAGGAVRRLANPRSRREVVVELTPTGARVVDQVTARRRREIAAVVARMPRGARSGLVTALTAFAEAGAEPLVRTVGAGAVLAEVWT